MNELIILILLVGGASFIFGIIYPAVMVVGYKLFGGKKPIKDYIKTL